jgi:hypothetical protein
MRYIIFSFSFFPVLFFGGCKTCQPKKIGKAKADVCFPIANPSTLEGKELGEIRIKSASVKGDCLYAEVSYSACGNEPLYLLWDDMLMKSLPPKASVKPVFVWGESRCRQLIEKNVCFSVKKLRENTRKTGLVLLLQGLETPIEIPAEK